MALFDEKYKSTVVSYAPRNEQEAWIAIMHACIAVDEVVADEELEELSETLANNSFFEEHEVREYYRSVLLAHAKIGSKHLIDTSVDLISSENKANLFARTIELVLADGVVADKEEELIRYLFSAMDLEEAVARNIVKEILERHKGRVDI
ncbi:TerB family tellurite resistance protein [Adhaeribacter rhizoryzae]|uniref:TerB family tellurite resistance protein n=1 Tax=Adhaeribacter rhizoryzae TaxID=2607907 RepID=A0A5M6DMN8_9BACT|nr:TerB family tellurite resistance protein [Adhaeribacter rhizoryzae]KAA5547499.1 TerB family tellurite resistance protein [Adhaeribacter rhizoryzae]